MPEDLDMRLKILSLELMLGVLENSGPVLQGSLRFINGAIKKYLCNSILMNGVSPVPRVFQASLSLFSTLINKFNQHLKVRAIFSPLPTLQHTHPLHTERDWAHLH